MNDVNLMIKAIQVLNGNAPERIVAEEFNALQSYFPEEHYSFKEYTLCNSDTARMYKDIRFFNDLNPVKGMIYEEAIQFASKIKGAIPLEVLKQHQKELDNKIDLPLGEIPTFQEAMLLFSKDYKAVILESAVIENEEKGYLEIKSRIPIKDSPELISAGFSSFSPNYNQLFKTIGLESEFAAFEAICNKKVRWDESYLLAVASSDVADINDKERCLQSLGEEIESCRKILHEKLNLFYNAIKENSIPLSNNERAGVWTDQKIRDAFKGYGYISHNVDEKNELVVVYSQRTPANGNPYCLQTFQGDGGIQGFLIPLQNYKQEQLYDVKPMHLRYGEQYLYTGGAMAESVKYQGCSPKGRKFQFCDSKNEMNLSPNEVMNYIKTDKQQVKQGLKLR